LAESYTVDIAILDINLNDVDSTSEPPIDFRVTGGSPAIAATGIPKKLFKEMVHPAAVSKIFRRRPVFC
jgi:hypothetical protein